MAQFINETFVGSDGTELSALDADFTKRRGTPNLIVAGNRLRISAAGEAVYSHATAPASADYSVSITFRRLSSVAFEPCPLGRMSTDGNTYYQANFNGSQWRLRARVAGVNTWIDGGAVTATTTNGGDYKLTLDMVGSTIRVLVDDVEVISVTDSSISAAGLAGLYEGTGATPGDTTGQHISSFSADEAGASTGFDLDADPLALAGSLSISGDIASVVKKWRVPTTAAESTAVHVSVLTGTSPTYTIAAQGTATVDASGNADISGSGTLGTKALAFVHNYDDNDATVSINGGAGIATLVDAG